MSEMQTLIIVVAFLGGIIVFQLDSIRRRMGR